MKSLILISVFIASIASAQEHGDAANDQHEAGPAATHQAADAEGHHDQHATGHPTGLPASVVYQGINFLIFAGLGYYFLRGPVRNFFGGRRERYHAALNKAAVAKREAEARKQEIADKLRNLETSSQQTLAQARAEAEALSAKIVQEANDLSKNLREEANRTAQAEINRAKDQLRDELLSQSVTLSKKVLTEKMADQDQKRLQTEFVDKIQETRG